MRRTTHAQPHSEKDSEPWNSPHIDNSITGKKRQTRSGQPHVVAQHVRVANRQLRRLQGYIVESADDVAADSCRGAADWGPTTPDRRTDKRWPTTTGAGRTRNFGCTHVPGWNMNLQRTGFRNTARGFGSGLQHGKAMITHLHDSTARWPATAAVSVSSGRARVSAPASAAKRSPTSTFRKHPQKSEVCHSFSTLR